MGQKWTKLVKIIIAQVMIKKLFAQPTIIGLIFRKFDEIRAPNFSTESSFGRNFLFITAASPISIHRITFEHGVISNTCFLDGFQGRNFCVCVRTKPRCPCRYDDVIKIEPTVTA